MALARKTAGSRAYTSEPGERRLRSVDGKYAGPAEVPGAIRSGQPESLFCHQGENVTPGTEG